MTGIEHLEAELERVSVMARSCRTCGRQADRLRDRLTVLYLERDLAKAGAL